MLQTAPTSTIEAVYPDRDWTYRSTVFFLRVGEHLNAAIIEALGPFRLQFSDYRYLSRNPDHIPSEMRSTFDAADMVVQQTIASILPRILADEDPGFRILSEAYDHNLGHCRHEERRSKVVCLDCPKVRRKR